MGKTEEMKVYCFLSVAIAEIVLSMFYKWCWFEFLKYFAAILFFCPVFLAYQKESGPTSVLESSG